MTPLDRSPVHHRVTKRQTTIHTDIHNYGQWRVSNSPQLYVSLGEAGKPGENPRRQQWKHANYTQKVPRPGIKSTKFLWGHKPPCHCVAALILYVLKMNVDFYYFNRGWLECSLAHLEPTMCLSGIWYTLLIAGLSEVVDPKTSTSPPSGGHQTHSAPPTFDVRIQTRV